MFVDDMFFVTQSNDEINKFKQTLGENSVLIFITEQKKLYYCEAKGRICPNAISLYIDFD